MVRNSAIKKTLVYSTICGKDTRRPTREIDGAVVVRINLIDHVLELGLGRILSQASHDGSQLLGCDLTCKRDILISFVRSQGELACLLACLSDSTNHLHLCPAHIDGFISNILGKCGNI